ncbi:MAG TPA: hypothetical protein VMG12_22340 [Polyangiaceae bacterium]|nr:hypothetical protein [Polyangiaceae bacterium]
MTARASRVALGACVGAALSAGLAGCHQRSESEAPAPASAPTTPDRLAEDEKLPEAETAFGLALPAGLRLVRHFNDAAYFSGDLPFEAVLEHVRSRVKTDGVQLLNQGALFARATVAGNDSGQLLRIEISKTPRGTQLHIKDITPPPAITGVSEADIWRQAGRKPDGTPLDPNNEY